MANERERLEQTRANRPQWATDADYFLALANGRDGYDFGPMIDLNHARDAIDEAIAALSPSPSESTDKGDAVEPSQERARNLLAFLNGASSLEGRWFSDTLPGRGPFWWRKYLPELERALSRREAAPPIVPDGLLRDAWGALNFILAFHEPGQKYLDTEAWKQAEANARAVRDRLLSALSSPPAQMGGQDGE